MHRLSAFCAVILAAVSSCTCFGELVLTAELLPISGNEGLNSYRITATSDLGNIVGFDFSNVGSYGITGPLSQQNPFGQSSVFSNQIFGGLDPSVDTQFLFNSNDVLNLFSEESTNSLNSVFAIVGDRQLTIGNSVPFVQIATTNAQDVLLKGSLVMRRPNNEYVSQDINIRLSDILIGAAPNLDILPVPPPITEVITTPTVLPPASPVGTVEQTSTPPEQPTVPAGTEPQSPQVGITEIDQSVVIAPTPVISQPPIFIPAIGLPDTGVALFWRIDGAAGLPPTLVQFIPDNGNIDTTASETIPYLNLWEPGNTTYMTDYNAVATDGDGMNGYGFVTTAIAYDTPFSSAFDGQSVAAFGQPTDADQSRAEVPEPTSAAISLLSIALAVVIVAAKRHRELA